MWTARPARSIACSATAPATCNGRTPMTGMRSSASIERRNGRHWGWEASTTIESPEFESNDAGRLTTGDGLQLAGQIEYRETVPGRWWREYAATIGLDNEWNWGRE